MYITKNSDIDLMNSSDFFKGTEIFNNIANVFSLEYYYVYVVTVFSLYIRVNLQ